MKDTLMTNNKKWVVFPGILLGLAILCASIFLKPTPDLQANYDNARLVEILSLEKHQATPQIQGFGRVSVKQNWQGIAEVQGDIIFRHPDLEVGNKLTKGTLVLQVDPLEYQLKRTQAEANLQAAKAQLTRLEQNERNLHASLTIEKKKLVLIEQEHQRNLSLQKKDLISNSALENQLQQLLIQQNTVQQLSSSLALLPDDKKVLSAQININQALVEDSLRKINKTQFILPFDVRISQVNIEQSQAVTLGSVLFEAQHLGKIEVEAKLSLQDVEVLRKSLTAIPQAINATNITDLNLRADIVLTLGQDIHTWPAVLTRIATGLDEQQDTIGFYLEVEQDPKSFLMGVKPPLTQGMFVSANIYGLPSSQFIIPESALHENSIYIMDPHNNLQVIPVQVLFRNNQGVVINAAIQAHQRLILNDLIPAIPGMKLKLKKEINNDHNIEVSG